MSAYSDDIIEFLAAVAYLQEESGWANIEDLADWMDYDQRHAEELAKDALGMGLVKVPRGNEGSVRHVGLSGKGVATL